MYLTVRGLVLRVTTYNDTDALIVLLTEAHGKLTVKARGLRKKNSRLSAPCQLLAYGEFVLFEYKDMYTINEAHAIELFQGLRSDLDKLALGTYFAQVSDVISMEDTPTKELLSLTLNCLFALDKLKLNHKQIKAVFEMRVAAISGYLPDLSGCSHCGALYPDRFCISEGRLACAKCRIDDNSGIRLPISAGVLDSMRYICACESSRLFQFEAGENTLQSLSQITEAYLSTQLERGFSALDFYKSLQL